MATMDTRGVAKTAHKAGSLIAALDIGSSKIACLIGRIEPGTRAGFTLVGGHRPESGQPAG